MPTPHTAGSALMFGLGGELVGTALPVAIGLGTGQIRAARGAVDAASGAGLQDALGVTHSRAAQRRAKDAASMPPGADRARALHETKPHQMQQIAKRVAKGMKAAKDATASLGGKQVERKFSASLPEDSPAQMNWATAQTDGSALARAKIVSAGGDPPSTALLRELERGFDGTTDRASWFSHTRRMLPKLAKHLGKDLPDGVRQPLDEVHNRLSSGATDPAIFGDGAELLDDLNRARTGGLQDVPDGVDARTVQALLERQDTGAGLKRQHVQSAVDGLENLADFHARNETASPEAVSGFRDQAAQLRSDLALSDEVHQASIAAARSEPTADDSPDGPLAGLAALAASAANGQTPPAFLPAMHPDARQLEQTQAAARWVSQSTARAVAGVSRPPESPQAGDHLARFTEGYATPEASFEAKRSAMAAVLADPTLLVDTVSHASGSLPAVHPALFMQVVARITKGLQYLQANMPAGIQSGLLFPNGSSPPRSSLREFAMKWETIFYPETVYEDVSARVASRQQMQVFQDNHPDLYGQLQQDTVEQVGTHFRSIPSNTKSYLDILFGTDGMAGPMFSSYAAQQIGISIAERSGLKPSASATLPANAASAAAPNPGGLQAIQTSVTNKAG